MKFVLFREGEKPSLFKILLTVPLIVLVIPLAAIGGIVHTLQQRSLARKMLKEWAGQEKYILLCYYNGSIWRNYVENEVIPKWDKYIIAMNWSEDKEHQVKREFAELAHKVFDKYIVDYDYPSPEEDEEMRGEYQIALLALHPDGKVKEFSTYPMSPKEIMKYDTKTKSSFEKVITDCLASWKVK
jgi:hypothetical protein